MKKILIVDDDAELGSQIGRILADAGYRHEWAASCREALEKAGADSFDVVLLDLIMPGGGGADCITELKRRSPRLKIIVITAFATIPSAVDAIKKGACDYIAKPFKIEEILTAVRRSIAEAGFENRGDKKDYQAILSTFASPVRTDVIRLLSERKQARVGDLAEDLGIKDRAKLFFHLKKLHESGLVEGDKNHTYALTIVGEIAVECLKVIESHLFSGFK